MHPTDIKPIFSDNPIDRMDAKRSQMAQHRLDSQKWPNQRYLLLSNNQILLNRQSQSHWFSPNEVPEHSFSQNDWVYLGEFDKVDYFAQALDAEETEPFEAVGLRAFCLSDRLESQWLGLLAQANSLLNWHSNHGFCAKCGAKSNAAYGGWRRDCLVCEAQHFPRTDPVVIMLVTHQDKCLLGRGHNFGNNRYSCLAGFMEPGETIAQAARRELFEEAGIKGGKVQFLFDQPWPFPSNLMMGVHVEALDSDIKIDPNELADALWASKEEVKLTLAGQPNERFELPMTIAIARNLLQYWVSQ